MGVVNQITDLDNSSKARPCNFGTFKFMQNNMQITSTVATSKPADSPVFALSSPLRRVILMHDRNYTKMSQKCYKKH